MGPDFNLDLAHVSSFSRRRLFTGRPAVFGLTTLEAFLGVVGSSLKIVLAEGLDCSAVCERWRLLAG